MKQQPSTASIISDIEIAIDTISDKQDWADDTDRLDMMPVAELLESIADILQNRAHDAADEKNYQADVERQVGGY